MSRFSVKKMRFSKVEGAIAEATLRAKMAKQDGGVFIFDNLHSVFIAVVTRDSNGITVHRLNKSWPSELPNPDENDFLGSVYVPPES